MTKEICIKCYVSGKVQGVWYRANTQKQAEKLGLTGWAKNLSDGRVEVMACGDKIKLEKLYQWMQAGPDLAQVEDVTYEEVPYHFFKNFQVC